MAATYLVTGGAGFIGSNLVHHLLETEPEAKVVVFDRLTYAGNLDNLATVADSPRYRFIQGDICDRDHVRQVLSEVRPTVVYNLAAESHVDRSIDAPGEFVRTNVSGTFEMLDATRASRPRDRRVSQEVSIRTRPTTMFGSLGPSNFSPKRAATRPTLPMQRRRWAAHLARAYFHTYGLLVLTTNCSNNYVSYQFPEKLIRSPS
jgi:dTDP-glucose 4,6-dehydratase